MERVWGGSRRLREEGEGEGRWREEQWGGERREVICTPFQGEIGMEG